MPSIYMAVLSIRDIQLFSTVMDMAMLLLLWPCAGLASNGLHINDKSNTNANTLMYCSFLFNHTTAPFF